MAEDDYDGPSDQGIEDSYASTWLSFQNELGRERFRDWLAAHDARVRAEALTDHRCEDQAERAYRRVEQAEAAVARVQHLHRDDGTGDCTGCDVIDGMGESWPCSTILALNGEE